MAAPGGFINGRVMRLAREQGYILVGTCKEWMNSPGVMALPGSVNRVNVRRHFDVGTIKSIVEGHTSLYILRQARAAALWVPKNIAYAWSHR
jgi:hypothetical protein